MTEESKSAIDIIYEMHDMISKMQNKINALEKNNMLLTDLLAKQAMGNHDVIRGKESLISSQPKVEATLVSTPAIENTSASNTTAPLTTSSVPIIVQAGADNKEQSIKIFGTLKDKEGKILHSIPVAIVDAKTNTAVKTTKTNRAGEFMSFLPAGKYIAVATFDNNQQKFKSFDINKGMKDVEVSIV
jgi:hypothetical protein